MRSDEKTRHKCVKLMTTAAAAGEKRERDKGRRGMREEQGETGVGKWERGDSSSK